MGILYIITDRIRLQQSIFKIGKTQNENLRSLETRYRNTIKEPILLGFIEVGIHYEVMERTLLNMFLTQRINHGGKGESEWIQMPYYILVLAIKYVIVTVQRFNLPPVTGSIKGTEIIPEHYVVNNLAEIQKKTLEELNIIPPFFEQRLVNHTQTLENFEPDIFGCELLFIAYQHWPPKMKEYYAIFRPLVPSVPAPPVPSVPSESKIIPSVPPSGLKNVKPMVMLDPREFLAERATKEVWVKPGSESEGGILTTIKSYFSFMTATDPDLDCIKNTFLGDKRIIDAYLYMASKDDKLKPYRRSFDTFVDYLIGKFGSREKIIYAHINKNLLDDFCIIIYNNAKIELGHTTVTVNTKSYTYLVNVTCKHIMINGKNKGKYCNHPILMGKDKCSKH